MFYNESAAALLGVSFEDAGRMGPEGGARPSVPSTRPASNFVEELPLTIALRQGVPAHSHFTIRSLGATNTR